MKLIHYDIAGSHLFGTNVQNSDKDYKGVYIPSEKEILLGKTVDTKTKNNPDVTIHSLQKYLQLLSKMEGNCIEMLYSKRRHPLFEDLFQNRFEILTNNKKCFLGFAKSQIMRYSVRGDKYKELKYLVWFLNKTPGTHKISSHKGYLLGCNGVEYFTDGTSEYIDFHGKKVAFGVSIKEARSVYQKLLDSYGERTKKSAGGVDWKGLYHAQRIVDEGIELFTTGKIEFPLKNAKYYIEIRNQKHSLLDVVDHFEEKIKELEILKPIRKFKEKPNKDWIENFICKVHKEQIK